MATQIQFRRGTASQHSSFTGATAEVTVNTTNKSVHVHDGSTAGGFELARKDLSTSSNVSLSGITTLTTLIVSDGITASGIVTATDFNATSDINLKENIRSIQNPSEIISGLEGVRFVWKADGKESFGVIAQEVEKTLPELVSNGDTKTVNYNGLIGVLIEAVKDQQKQINSLKTEIELLKSR